MRIPGISSRTLLVTATAAALALVLAVGGGAYWAFAKVAPWVSIRFSPGKVVLKVSPPVESVYKGLILPKMQPMTGDVRYLEVPKAEASGGPEAPKLLR